MRRPRKATSPAAAAARAPPRPGRRRRSCRASWSRPRSSRPTSRPCRRTRRRPQPRRPPVQRRRPHPRQAARPQAGQGPRRRHHARWSVPARAASSRARTSQAASGSRRFRDGRQRALLNQRDAPASARPARAHQGRPQDDGAGDGRLGLHRPPRHRVGHRRRHPHDGVRRAAQDPPRVPRGQGLAAAGAGAGRAAGRRGVRPRSTPAGTSRPRRSCSRATSTSASPRPPRAAWSCPTSRTPRTSRCSTSPPRSTSSPRPRATARPSRPT